MVRIEHGVWCQRAVVELRKGVHKKASDGGNPNEALNWAARNGIADPEAAPYTEDDKPLVFAPDRSGRTVRLPAHGRLPNANNMESVKRWIDAVGPVVTWFDVYTDFDDNANIVGKVYRKQPGARERGGHFLLVV